MSHQTVNAIVWVIVILSTGISLFGGLLVWIVLNERNNEKRR